MSERQDEHPAPVSRLTHTASLAELAESTDRILAERGADVPARLVDDVLNESRGAARD